MIENLVDCILNYKIKCHFNSIDFDVDKSLKCKENQRPSSLRLIPVALDQNYFMQNQLK